MNPGYEPSRITTLKQQSLRAAGGLRGIQSSDPAASSALDALARLRTVVESGILPAADAVADTDPLGGSGAVFGLGGTFAPSRDTTRHQRDDWYDRQFPSSRFSDWTNDEIFDVTDEQLDWAMTLHLWEQPDHFFFSDDLPELAIEFRLRAATDPDFEQWLIDEAEHNPLIGLIVAEGGFSDDVLAAVTIATARGGTSGWDEGAIRSLALDALMGELDTRTDVAIVLFADPEAFEQLFTWNEHEHTTRPIDQARLEAILSNVLDAPFTDAEKLNDVHLTIANVVDLADHKYFDSGFPPGLAKTVATGIIPYLPFIIGSLNEVEGVRIRDFDGDRATLIGTNAEVADLFGNLLRDPVTRGYLLDTVLALTLTADPDSDFYALEDVQKYIDILLNATKIEQIEEEILAARERDRWNLTIDIVFGLVDKGLEAGGKKFEAARSQMKWVKEGARWLVDQIDADEIGLDDVPLSIRVMFSIGLAVAFLASFEPDDEDEEEQAAEAQDTLAEIQELFGDAKANGSPIDLGELSAKVRDLEDDIKQLDEDAFVPITEVGLDPEVLVPERDAEATE